MEELQSSLEMYPEGTFDGNSSYYLSPSLGVFPIEGRLTETPH
jgi:hypothetical protein